MTVPMDRHLRAMIDHALRWMPFDGADDLVFVEFGTAPITFYRRITEALGRSDIVGHLASDEREALRDQCRRKLRHLAGVSRQDSQITSGRRPPQMPPGDRRHRPPPADVPVGSAPRRRGPRELP